MNKKDDGIWMFFASFTQFSRNCFVRRTKEITCVCVAWWFCREPSDISSCQHTAMQCQYRRHSDSVAQRAESVTFVMQIYGYHVFYAELRNTIPFVYCQQWAVRTIRLIRMLGETQSKHSQYETDRFYFVFCFQSSHTHIHNTVIASLSIFTRFFFRLKF